MTHAEAMHDALFRSFSDRKLGPFKGWEQDAEIQVKWKALAECGLAAGRASLALGVRGVGITQATAQALYDGYSQSVPPMSAHKDREIAEHWMPAAEALIAAAREASRITNTGFKEAERPTSEAA